jgi:hypothetical protein
LEGFQRFSGNVDSKSTEDLLNKPYEMGDSFAPRSMKRKNVKGLALTPAAPKPPPTAETGRMGDSRDDANKDEQLEIGIEYKLDLKPEDLEIVKELGHGNGGTVSKVKHLTTGTVMARKVRRLFSCSSWLNQSVVVKDHPLNVVSRSSTSRQSARSAKES